MSCSTCGAIGGAISANTGREEYLPTYARALKRHELGGREDLRECPTCGAFFVWEDDTAFTGSGVNDEERLTRIPEERAAIVRACVHREGEAAAVASRIEDDLFALPRLELGLVLEHVRKHDRDLGRRFLPRLAKDLLRTRDLWIRDQLCSFAYPPHSDAALILELVERAAGSDPAFEYLLDACKRYA